MFPFYPPIVLRGLNTCPLMNNSPRIIKLRDEELRSIFSSNSSRTSVKLVHYHGNNLLDMVRKFCFGSTKIIKYSEEIFMIMDGSGGNRTPYVKMYLFKSIFKFIRTRIER